jgi:uncharacterized membrane protein YkvA (DUF1232 family)
MSANQMPGGSGRVTGNVLQQLMQAGKLIFDSRVPFSLKLMLPFAALLYWLWPLDLMPVLPFDDLAVMFVALTAFVQLANQAIAKQARQQYTGGSPTDPSSGSAGANDGVVDTTWRVIE